MVMFWGQLLSIRRFTGIYMRRVWIPFLFGFSFGVFGYDDGKTKEGKKPLLSPFDRWRFVTKNNGTRPGEALVGL
jgi:hypothetical protein